MGIDIYAKWNGQTADEHRKQISVWLSAWDGAQGYLREAYHGGPYATMLLCSEAFATGEARIRASRLAERLPKTLVLVAERERKLYRAPDEAIEKTKQSYRDFVAFCERKERETGEPMRIIADY